MELNKPRRVLIQCGDHFENQRRIFLLAKEIYNLGHVPIILMYKEGKGNIFKAHGIEVIALNTYLGKISNKDINFQTKIYKDMRVIDFINVEIKRQPKLGWPSQIQRTANMTVRYVEALNTLLLQYQVDRIVIWNGFTGYVANILRGLASSIGLKCAFIERGFIKESLFLDYKGVNGGSSINSNDLWSNYQEVEDVLVNKLFSKPLTHNNSTISEDLINKKIIFFPLQVQLDTNILLYCKYKSMREVFFEMYKYLNSEDTVFVIRPHPEEDSSTLINMPLLPNVLVSADSSLEYWLEKSSLVVTVNSTVGLEALLYKKPVICLGESIYSNLSILSNYHCINNDNDAIYLETSAYLKYLFDNHLLTSNKDNSLIVEKQLFLQRLDSGCNISEMKSDPLLDILKKKKSVNVFCMINFNTTLDLTYRKNREILTRDWLISILSVYFENAIKFVNSIALSEVVIVEENFDVNKIDSKKSYIDVYGNILKGNMK